MNNGANPFLGQSCFFEYKYKWPWMGDISKEEIEKIRKKYGFGRDGKMFSVAKSRRGVLVVWIGKSQNSFCWAKEWE